MVSFSVVPSADRQGVEMETVIKALAPRFTVDVLTVRTAEMGYVERYHHTRMLRVPVGSGSLYQQVQAFRRAVKRQLEGAEYDVIHFRSAYGGVPICQLKEYLDCKLVFELALTSSTEKGRIDKRLLDRLVEEEQYCIDRSDLLIARSPTAAASLKGVSCPVTVVPPGVDIDTFDWEPSVPHATRRIVYVGTVGQSRGIRVLLEAFHELLEYTDARLVLVGPVPEIFSKYLQNALSRLKLAPHVQLLGPVDHAEIPRVLAMADLCVCPWSPDPSRPLMGSPLKLLEYMACRKPAIVADQPAIRELLGPRPPVQLVSSDHGSDLASAMLGLLAESDASNQLSADAYHFVRANFSAAAARRALLSAYSKLFSQGASPWGHAGVASRVSSDSYTARTGSDRFHDTLPYDERAFSFNGTPSGGIRATGSQLHLSEDWILLPTDVSGDEARQASTDTSTDPQFVAAGPLLGSELKNGPSPPDTSPGTVAPDNDVGLSNRVKPEA